MGKCFNDLLFMKTAFEAVFLNNRTKGPVQSFCLHRFAFHFNVGQMGKSGNQADLIANPMSQIPSAIDYANGSAGRQRLHQSLKDHSAVLLQ